MVPGGRHGNEVGRGVTCGIDLALSLMETERGPLFASRLARELILYIRRDKDHPQVSVYLDYRSHQNPGVHAVQDWMIEHPDQGVDLPTLAAPGFGDARALRRLWAKRFGMSPRELAGKA